MENSEPQKNQQDQTLVTTDDLIFELGKQIIDQIRKEKTINQLSNKIQDYENQLKFIQESNEKRIKSLEDEIMKYKSMIQNQEEPDVIYPSENWTVLISLGKF